MQFDYSRLRGRLRERYRQHAAFAAAANMSPCTLSQKLNGRSEWTAEDIRITCDLLGIPLEEIHLYFFTPEVENSHHSEEAAV